MNSKDSVYKFIIDNINSVIDDGIYYYDTIDEDIKDKLKNIKDYINNIDKVEEIEELIEDNDEVKEIVEELPQIEMDFSKINSLSKNYINKITDLKVSILNLESKIPQYQIEDDILYQELSFNNINTSKDEESETIKVENNVEADIPIIKEIEPIDMSQVFDDLLNDEDIVKELKELKIDDEELVGIEIKSNNNE